LAGLGVMAKEKKKGLALGGSSGHPKGQRPKNIYILKGFGSWGWPSHPHGSLGDSTTPKPVMGWLSSFFFFFFFQFLLLLFFVFKKLF
jgi:hypothetical protein